MKLPHTEVKFYPEVKSQTGLSSLRVSCKRALNDIFTISLQYQSNLILSFYVVLTVKYFIRNKFEHFTYN